MTKLEDITVGSSVKGIISNSTVTIVAVQWYGNNVLEITYKDSHGQPGNQMLLRDEEINLTVMDNTTTLFRRSLILFRGLFFFTRLAVDDALVRAHESINKPTLIPESF